MPKEIHPSRLVLQRYPHRISVEPRYADMDTYAHLNNVTIGTYYENARAHLLAELFQNPEHFSAHSPTKTLLAEITLRYLAEGSFPDTITIGSGIGHLGNSAFTIEQALFQRNQCIGIAEATMVYQLEGTSTRISGDLRERFTAKLLADK